MTDKNIGIFEIREGFIREEPERVAEVFALMKFIPVRAEMLFARDVVEYTGISAAFPEVEANCKIPKYVLQITQSEAGNVECVEALLI